MPPHDIMVEPVIGLIGGSGLYDIEGLEEKEWRTVETPWGAPSDALLFGRLGGVRCVFLPRHGRGHPIPPSRPNYRANIAAMKISGVTDIVSLSAVGSLREELPPGQFVVIDQFIDPLVRPREELLRHRLRGPCVDGGSALPAHRRRAGAAGDGARPAGVARRHLPRDGRAAILHPGREQTCIRAGAARSSA